MGKKRKNSATPKVKTVTLKKHHKKPYRKRHIGALVLSLAGVLVALSLLLWYRDSLTAGAASARSFVSSLFIMDAKQSSDETATVRAWSTHGVGVSYDSRLLYGSAVDASTGRLYVGAELAQKTPYTSLRLAQVSGVNDIAKPEAQATFTMNITPGSTASVASSGLSALANAGIATKGLVRQSDAQVTLGGKEFTKSVWAAEDASVLGLVPRYAVYVTKVGQTLVTIVIAEGVHSSDDNSLFGTVLKSISFDETVSSVPLVTVASAAARKQPAVIDALDFITGTRAAFAASEAPSVDSAEKNSVLYSPAVVKIYNAYCMDISVGGQEFMKNVCQAATGSGFIVTEDGYIGTNGHVATADPQDIAIYNALVMQTQKNDSRFLAYLVSTAGLKQSDVAGKTAEESRKIIIDALYNIPASTFTATNDVQNLLVNISHKRPDVEGIVEATKTRKKFATNDDVVRAEVVSFDYKSGELFSGGLKASDVALIKLDSGNNYPTVALGDITDVTQGAGLSIIGYPGQASDNGIVSSDAVTPTLTSGKVSAVKDASGGGKRLIETDTTIGHGNSGGPALSEAGQVVGVATYTSDGSGQGNGTYNYVRDIADFKTLLDKSAIAAPSETQLLWEEGVDKYYKSHYSSAVARFEKVKALYPNHAKVAEFITSAEKHIANGDDVSEFPIWVVWVGLIVLIVGAGGSTLLIVMHSKRHKAYAAGVSQGVIQPMVVAAGDRPVVTVTPAAPVVQVHEATQLYAPAPQASVQQVQPVIAPPQPVMQSQPVSVAPQPIPGPVPQAPPTVTTIPIQDAPVPPQQPPMQSVFGSAVPPQAPPVNEEPRQ